VSVAGVRAGQAPPAVGVERVVDGQLSSQILVVVADDLAEARGDRVEPPRLAGQLARARVGTPDDLGERVERGVVEPVDGEERVEGAAVAVVPELDAGHVVGPGASRRATSRTWSAGTNRNVGSGSMNRRMSHGQAIRSTRAFSRVTHFIAAPSLSRPSGRTGQPRRRPRSRRARAP